MRFELLALEAKARGHDKAPDVQLAYKQSLVRALTAKEVAELVTMDDVTDADVHAARGSSRSRPRDRPTSIVDANARARRIVAANIARDGPSRATRRRGIRRRSRRGMASGNEWVVFCFTMGPVDRS